MRLRGVWGAAAAVAEYAPRCYRACFLNIFSRSKCNCWATYLLGKRVRNCQLIVLPVRRRAGQAIFDCSRECSGTPLVGPARAHGPETNGRKHSRRQTLHTNKRMHIERERERKKERKREREREREREKHHSLLSMTCIPDLHRSLAPRDPNQLLPLGLADGLYFCGTRIPPTRGVAPLSPHSAGRIGCTRVLRAPTTAPSSQTHCPPQSTPKQSPPKQRQSHRAQGTTAPCLQMHCPSSPPKQHASPKPQASPKQRRLPRM